MKVLGVEVSGKNPAAEACDVLGGLAVDYLRLIERNFMRLSASGSVAMRLDPRRGLMLRVQTKGVAADLAHLGAEDQKVIDSRDRVATAFRCLLGVEFKVQRLGGLLRYSGDIPMVAACRKLRLRFFDLDGTTMPEPESVLTVVTEPQPPLEKSADASAEADEGF